MKLTEKELLEFQAKGRKIGRIIFALMCLIVATAILSSCGSIKKDISSTKETEKTNELTASKTEIEKWGKNISQTLEPADLKKPMLISRNGKIDTVWNTRIINKTEYIKEIIKDTTTKQKQSVKEAKNEVKHVERDNTKLIVWCFGLFLLFLFILIVAFFYIQSKKISSISSLLNKIP